jgi:hypothetical protein
MSIDLDYELLKNICLSLVTRQNRVYGMLNIEERIKNLFSGPNLKPKVQNFIIDTCNSEFMLKVEKITINDVPKNIRTNSQILAAYFRTNDLIIILSEEVPYLSLNKSYVPFCVCEQNIKK